MVLSLDAQYSKRLIGYADCYTLLDHFFPQNLQVPTDLTYLHEIVSWLRLTGLIRNQIMINVNHFLMNEAVFSPQIIDQPQLAKVTSLILIWIEFLVSFNLVFFVVYVPFCTFLVCISQLSGEFCLAHYYEADFPLFEPSLELFPLNLRNKPL